MCGVREICELPLVSTQLLYKPKIAPKKRVYLKKNLMQVLVDLYQYFTIFICQDVSVVAVQITKLRNRKEIE